MSNYKWSLVAVCGKFQPFHSDHLKYVLTGFEVGEHVIIGITNPDPESIRMEEADPQRSTPEANPFTYYERYLMVVGCLRDLKIDPLRYEIVPFPINIPDRWFYYIPKQAVILLTLYDEDKWLNVRKRKLEVGGFRTEVLWTKQTKDIVGAEVRRQIRLGLDWEKLVPQATAKVINDSGLDKRIKKHKFEGHFDQLRGGVGMNCPFCEELSTGMLPAEYGFDIDSRTIDETKHFAVISDISPLAQGHLLIIPKAHIINFGAVPVENHEELGVLIDKVQSILSKYYSPPVIIEHGSSSCSDGGGCITHAHLQVFPGDIDILDSLSHFNVVRISSFWEISKWSQRDEPYVFFQNQKGEMFVASNINKIQKQFIRIEIARRIGLPNLQWDWRKNILYQNLIETVKMLKEVWI